MKSTQTETTYLLSQLVRYVGNITYAAFDKVPSIYPGLILGPLLK